MRGFSTVAYALANFLDTRQKCWPKRGKTKNDTSETDFKNNFPNAAVRNARLFNRGLCLGKTFLTRGKSVGQNEAKRSKKDCEGAVRR